MKYQELQIEKQLLKSAIDTSPLNVLQHNSITHLKQTQENSTIFYRSLDQHQSSLRLIVFSVLTKIYSHYTPSNAQRLKTLKALVYDSPLNTQITSSRGIQKGQLLKLFAQKLCSLQVGPSAEAAICNLMNSSVFFQQMLLLGFEQGIEAFGQQHIEQANLCGQAKPFELQEQFAQFPLYLAFFKKQFDFNIKIIAINQTDAVEQENQLLFHTINQHLYKKSTKHIELSSLSSSSAKQSTDKDPKALILLQSIRMNNTVSLEEMSPLHNSSKQKSSRDYSVCSGKKAGVEGSGQKKKKKKKSQDNSFFSMFCCCS